MATLPRTGGYGQSTHGPHWTAYGAGLSGLPVPTGRTAFAVVDDVGNLIRFAQSPGYRLPIRHPTVGARRDGTSQSRLPRLHSPTPLEDVSPVVNRAGSKWCSRAVTQMAYRPKPPALEPSGPWPASAQQRSTCSAMPRELLAEATARPERRSRPLSRATRSGTPHCRGSRMIFAPNLLPT